jgi:hypothetical protein
VRLLGEAGVGEILIAAVAHMLLLLAFVIGLAAAGYLIVRNQLRRPRARLWEARLQAAATWDEVMGADLGGIPISDPRYVWPLRGRFSHKFYDGVATVALGADSNGVILIRIDSIPYRKRLITKTDAHDFVRRCRRLGEDVLEERHSGARLAVGLAGGDIRLIADTLRALGWTVTDG